MTSLNELYECLSFAEENLGECQAQYRSEVSLFGDAWPGACQDIEQCQEIVSRIKKKIVEHPDYVQPCIAQDEYRPTHYPCSDYDDIPF